LEGTIAEAHDIVRLRADDGKTQLLSGVAASETAICQKMPDARYVHLATHGFFTNPYQGAARRGSGWDSVFATEGYAGSRSTLNFRNPLILCGLVLAGANAPHSIDASGMPIGDDGILTGEEVAELDLGKTELVVLSACETGIGESSRGEGVFGLQRAFAMAGARSVIASLWQVDDAATRTLMAEFYRNLWQRRLPKLEALRQAQLTMLKHYDPRNRRIRGLELDNDSVIRNADPFHWAAFVLSGDWR
jgi:CHAT domain-containing protein